MVWLQDSKSTSHQAINFALVSLSWKFFPAPLSCLVSFATVATPALNIFHFTSNADRKIAQHADFLWGAKGTCRVVLETEMQCKKSSRPSEKCNYILELAPGVSPCGHVWKYFWAFCSKAKSQLRFLLCKSFSFHIFWFEEWTFSKCSPQKFRHVNTLCDFHF